jgi:hypothetical protein
MELLENNHHPENDMMLINYQEKNEFIKDCPKVSLTVLKQCFNLCFHKKYRKHPEKSRPEND